MPKIMIIDDTMSILKTFKYGLVQQDYDVEAFNRGKNAILEFKKNPMDYDAILLDYMMPEMDGLEVLSKIKEIDDYKPVIVCTAHGGTHVAVEFMKAGATDYIEKPVIHFDLLVHRIELCIEANDQRYIKHLKLAQSFRENQHFYKTVYKDVDLNRLYNDDQIKKYREKLGKYYDDYLKFHEHVVKLYGYEKFYFELDDKELKTVAESMEVSLKTVHRIIKRYHDHKEEIHSRFD